MSSALTPADAESFAACIEGGGVAVFPADTVYGLACDPENPDAVAKLYALKGRPADKPAAVMWFDREAALAALPEIGDRTRAAVERLTPGGVTLLLDNPHGRFPLAAPDPSAALGVRIPRLSASAAALAGTRVVVLQSSANASGGADARELSEVPSAIRAGADLALDAGPLPGTPSTVIDLTRYERAGDWTVLREGAVPSTEVAEALGIVGRR